MTEAPSTPSVPPVRKQPRIALTPRSRPCRSYAHSTKTTGTRKLPSRIRVGRSVVFRVAYVTSAVSAQSASPPPRQRFHRPPPILGYGGGGFCGAGMRARGAPGGGEWVTASPLVLLLGRFIRTLSRCPSCRSARWFSSGRAPPSGRGREWRGRGGRRPGGSR